MGIHVSDEIKDNPLNIQKKRNNFFNSSLDFDKFFKNEKSSKPAIELEKNLKCYRFMLYIQSISDIPKDIDMNKNYFIEYTLFDQKLKTKLELSYLQQKGKQIYLSVNKIKLFYFFANENTNVREFFRNENVRNLFFLFFF